MKRDFQSDTDLCSSRALSPLTTLIPSQGERFLKLFISAEGTSFKFQLLLPKMNPLVPGPQPPLAFPGWMEKHLYCPLRPPPHTQLLRGAGAPVVKVRRLLSHLCLRPDSAAY